MSLPRALPTAVGVDPHAVYDFFQAVEPMGCHSAMLIRHGQVCAEGWWKPYAPHYRHSLYSISKGFTCLAVGFAVAEGLLSPEDPVIRFFPDRLPCEPCAHMRAMRIKHLLMMGLGHQSKMDHDFFFEKDWLNECLRLYPERAPGTLFNYDNRCSLLCSAIVRAVTGQSLRDYLTPRLFEPLGIADVEWEAVQNLNPGGWGLSLTTEELAKSGLLLLHKGRWNGRSLVDPAWIEQASRKQIDSSVGLINGNPLNNNQVVGYGYHFWLCPQPGMYRGTGACGQHCVIMPEQDAVLAVTAGSDRSGDILNAAWEYLVPGMRSAVTPNATVHNSGQNTLTQYLAGLSLPMPGGAASSPAAARYSGKTYQMADNTFGITRLSFTFGEVDTVRIERGDVHFSARAGHGCWLENTDAVPGAADSMTSLLYADAACCAAWNGARYELKLAFTRTPFADTLSLEFDEHGVVGRYQCQPYLPLRGQGVNLMGRVVAETACAS